MSERRDRCWAVEPLVVEIETSPVSGEFVREDRLRADEVRVACDDRIGSAVVAVRLDDEFDAMAARRRYHADLRIRIRTDDADAARRDVLFEGYPLLASAVWDGRAGREDDSLRLNVEHVYGRLRSLRTSQIVGRHVRNGEIEDGLLADPAAWQGQSVLRTALACVFNAEGRPNCAADPLIVTRGDGASRAVPIFTYDGDPDAVAWTFAGALRYLGWFYLPRPGPIGEGNLFEATEAILTGGIAAEGWGRLTDALRGEPYDMNCEGASLVEAVAGLVHAAGVHVSAETAGNGATSLRLWSGGDGAVKWLHLARGGRRADGRPRYDTSARTTAEILRENDVYRAAIEWDARPAAHAVIVVGDVERYEVTVPLVPGWPPETNLDNVAPAQRDYAKALALTPSQVADLGPDAETSAWYRRYHRDGSEYAAGMAVARRWVLNEDGRYDAATYNRNAPFHAYAPFDFASVLGEAIARRGEWMRRPRPLKPPITWTPSGPGLPAYVEISFDSGATWQRWWRGVTVLKDEAGVFLAVTNPTQVTPPWTEPEVQNLWYALIDQTFRLRVTAVIESDRRLVREAVRGGLSGLIVGARVVREATRFGLARRSETADVLAALYPGGAAGERDDGDSAARLAEQLARATADRQVRAVPAIPWLAREFAVGDRIGGVRGRDLSFAATREEEDRLPTVIGKRYRLGGEGVGYETELLIERG